MIEGLKPCPSCGSVYGDGVCFAMSKPEGGSVRVECYKCGYHINWKRSFDKAKECWNRVMRPC